LFDYGKKGGGGGASSFLSHSPAVKQPSPNRKRLRKGKLTNFLDRKIDNESLIFPRKEKGKQPYHGGTTPKRRGKGRSWGKEQYSYP